MTVSETYKLEQENKHLKEKLESSDEYGNEMAEIVQRVKDKIKDIPHDCCQENDDQINMLKEILKEKHGS